jgi:hypothetical protein
VPRERSCGFWISPSRRLPKVLCHVSVCKLITGLLQNYMLFDRFLLLIWKSRRTGWASITVPLPDQHAIGACTRLKTLGTFVLISSAVVIIYAFYML